jgi:hypothetical protein
MSGIIILRRPGPVPLAQWHTQRCWVLVFEERLLFIRVTPRNPRTGFSGIVISVS